MKIVFVCTGNICRSPTAEAVARHFIAEAGLARSITVDSAGTQGYHVGEAPDPRTRQAALKRGYDLSGLRARKRYAFFNGALECVLLACDTARLPAHEARPVAPVTV